MELAQLHTPLPLDAPGVIDRLRLLLPAAVLHPWAELAVGVVGPWRPADRWPGSTERLLWTVCFHTPGDAVYTDEALARHARTAAGRRHAPAHPAEALAADLGSALVLQHSDAGRSAWVSVWAERRLRWSLLLEDGKRVVRCDGHAVMIEAPPRVVPEVDRAGVLLAAWERLLLDPLVVTDDERLWLADTLGAIADEAAFDELISRGRWVDEPRVAVAGGR